jgi:hypothetical protein
MIKRISLLLIILSSIIYSNIGYSQIRLEIVIQSKISDEIRVFYKTENIKSYNKDNSIAKTLFSEDTKSSLVFNLPIDKIDEFRIDFGLQPNQFKIYSIRLEDNSFETSWIGQEVINGFIPNSNIKILESSDNFSFESTPINGKFDPNMVINTNGINKIKLEVYNSDIIKRSSIKVVMNNEIGMKNYIWYVPMRYKEENYYLLPYRVLFFNNKGSKADTTEINLYSEDYISAFCLDFGRQDSSSLYLMNISFNDNFRSFNWNHKILNEKLRRNEFVEIVPTNIGLNIIFKGYLNNVGPRLYYEFDMNKLANIQNSIHFRLGESIYYINIYILMIIFFSFLAFLVNKKITALIKV